MIDRQIRSLIEYEYIHRKVSNLVCVECSSAPDLLSLASSQVKVWWSDERESRIGIFRAKGKYYSVRYLHDADAPE